MNPEADRCIDVGCKHAVIDDDDDLWCDENECAITIDTLICDNHEEYE